MHLGGLAGIAETQKMPAIDRIEINARCRRNTCFIQHAFCKIEAIVGEAGNVGVKVKRAVCRKKFVEPGFRQSFSEDAAIFLITVFHGFHLVAALESRLRRDLCECRHGNREIALQPFDIPAT